MILNRERLKGKLLKSRMRQGYLPSLLLLAIGFEVLAASIKTEKESKRKHIGKEELKPSSFADDAIFYIEDPEISTRKFLEMTSFNKVARHKSNL